MTLRCRSDALDGDFFQDPFLKLLSCVNRYATMVVATYVNLRKRAVDPAVRVPWHATRDSGSSRFSRHKQERIRKCTSGKGIPCTAGVKGIPFRRSAIHPFLSRVRLLSDVEKSAAGPSQFCYFPNPFYEISGFLAAACTVARSPSGCSYLALHLASNWFSGKKKNGSRRRRVKVMRKKKKMRTEGWRFREGKKKFFGPEFSFCAHMPRHPRLSDPPMTIGWTRQGRLPPERIDRFLVTVEFHPRDRRLKSTRKLPRNSRPTRCDMDCNACMRVRRLFYREIKTCDGYVLGGNKNI